MAAAPASPPTGPPGRPGRPAHWFPLALFGGLIALSVPLSQFASALGGPIGLPSIPGPVSLSVSGSSEHGSYFVMAHFGGAPGAGGYWTFALAAGFLLTAAWYRRQARRGGTRGAGTAYLVTGLLLTVAAAAGAALLTLRASMPAWLWLASPWSGTVFALPVIAAGFAVLARRTRSRALGIVFLAYTAAALLAAWPAVLAAWPALSFSGGDPEQAFNIVAAQPPFGYGAIFLPASVLLAAAAVILLRPLLPRSAQPA